MRIILIGYGTVGQGLTELLAQQADSLQTQYGFEPQIVGVATRSRGSLYYEHGLSLIELLQYADDLGKYEAAEGFQRGFPDATSLIERAEADVVVEVTPTNIRTGEPAIEHCHAAFATGKHVVTANKGPVALAYPELRDAARSANRHFRFESSVMAGTPTLSLALEGLAGAGIQSASGILNGTTNYMLTEMEKGSAYDDVLKTAQELGYAETDPTADVDGWDAAAKVLILLATVFAQEATLDDLDVSGIRDLTLDDIREVSAAGERYRLIATASPEGSSVGLQRLPLTNPLANVVGATNAISYVTENAGVITISGPGAGKRETAQGILADLIAIHRAQ